MTEFLSEVGDFNAHWTLFQNGTWTPTPVTNYVTIVVDPQGTVDFLNGSERFYAVGPVYLVPTVGNLHLGALGHANFYSRPFGGFKDFAIYCSANSKNDPVTNGFELAGTTLTTGKVGDVWKQHYMTFVPPKYVNFFAPTYVFRSAPAGFTQYVDAMQVQVIPVQTPGYVSTSPFEAARSLIVTAIGLVNMCQNPNAYGGSTSTWTGVTISNGIFHTTATATAAVDYLIAGNNVTMSAYVSGNSAPVTIKGAVTSGSASLPGGITRVWGTLPAAEGTTSLSLTSTSAFSFSRVMINAGDSPLDYFDGYSGSAFTTTTTVDIIDGGNPSAPGGSVIDGGNATAAGGSVIDGSASVGPLVTAHTTSTDYLWEQGGTQGLTRSYYYPGRLNRHGVLVRNLLNNMPVGMTLEEVQYAVNPLPSASYGNGSGYFGGSGSYN